MLRLIKKILGGNSAPVSKPAPKSKSGGSETSKKSPSPKRSRRRPNRRPEGGQSEDYRPGESQPTDGNRNSDGPPSSRSKSRRRRSGRDERRDGSERSSRQQGRRSRSGGGGGGRRREDSSSAEKYEPPVHVDPRPETPRIEMKPDAVFPPAFAELGFSEPILHGILAANYETPTPVQAKAAPLILDGRDVIGASQTGTGKTAAFGLPILTKLGSHGDLRCLILEPVRELAAQVHDAFMTFSAATDLRTTLLHGGVKYGKQNEGLMLGSDIVVATPGRLLDHLSRGTISLDKIEFLVLDEVDRMLDMGFLPDVRKIINKCPQNRQTLFFSATMPPQIDSLAKWALKDPAEVEVGRRITAAETVSHYFYPVASTQREELLLALLERTEFHSVMIFTRTKRDADMLFSKLQSHGEHKIAVLHSDIRQSDRTKALNGFREGSYEVIIATDLAARGLDISNVTHVINYQVPENSEDYVHRIGRTGRAQKEGDAFTLLSADELERAESIERLIGQKIEHRKLENFNYVYTTLLDDDAPDPDFFKKRKGRGGGKKRRR
ncbi:MAG: DEAD/DEAH box helicase [Verrucomicrobiota bacterium]